MIKVFVYGTLLDGESNSHFLGKSKLLGVICIGGFEMHDLGAFPALVEKIYPEYDSIIVGELYEIDEEILQRLDYLEGYPNFYNRKLVETRMGFVWVYYNNKAKDKPIIKSGDWRSYKEERMNK